MKMGRSCCIKTCKNTNFVIDKNSSRSFYRIPKVLKYQDKKTEDLSIERRNKWIKCLNLQPELVREHTRVCSRHFHSGAPSTLYDTTSPDWLPNRYLSIFANEPNEKSSVVRRYERRKRRSEFSTMVMSTSKKIVQQEHVWPSNTCFVDNEGSSFNQNQEGIIEIEVSVTPMTVKQEYIVPTFEENEEDISNHSQEDLKPAVPSMINLNEVIGLRPHLVDIGIQTSDTNEIELASQTVINCKWDIAVQTTETSEQPLVSVSDCATQTQMKPYLKKWSVSNCATQTQMKQVLEKGSVSDCTTTQMKQDLEKCTQTLFRVTELFELEAVNIKVEKLEKEIKELTSMLKIANEKLSFDLDESKSLKTQVEKLKKDIEEKSYYETSFIDNDDRVRYFTGLKTYGVLYELFKDVEQFLFKRSILTPFQQLILTIMKLRLALTNKDLAFRFSVSESTVTRVFYNCLHTLYEQLPKFISWPDRDELQKTMPVCFKEKFGENIAVIIDCFEVLIEKPSQKPSKADTLPIHKNQNTVKYLIGVTPQGAIGFLSKGRAGCVSDKRFTENSGFLENLIPDDVVLADQGFKIEDSEGLYYATIKLSDFGNGKMLLDPHEVTKKMASVRAHVKRVMGQIRQKYAILHSKVSIELLHVVEGETVPTIDKIALVACALTNLCRSVVPCE